MYYFYLFSVFQQRTSAPFSPKYQRKYNFDVRMTCTFKVRPYFSRLWGSFCIERCSKSLLSNRLIQLTLQHKRGRQPHTTTQLDKQHAGEATIFSILSQISTRLKVNARVFCTHFTVKSTLV